MLTPNLLHDYQKKAVNFQCTHPHSMLWLDMGLGKTVVTLTSIAHLLGTGYLRGVLIVAPIRVIRLVWRQEAAKWEHTKHLRFSMLTGTKDQRTRALMRPADVYLINYENLRWLAETLQTYYIAKDKPAPFNGEVWDEIGKMKNSATDRVKAVRKTLDLFVWTTGLTGTPASNGYKDLHGQFLVVDKGQRLGTSKTAFKSRFYRKVGQYREELYPDAQDTIKQLIGDITLEMSAEDYNPLPDLIVNDIEVEMDTETRAKYEQLEKEFFVQLDAATTVEVFNQGSMTNKALQFSNGAVYPVAGMPLWTPVHDLKLDALEEIIDEAQGSPVLCAYAYRSDAERIMERFKHLRPINLTECKTEGSLTNAMDRWKKGDCTLMIGHPACLHPSTEVLTELRGWVKITDVRINDRVFDGVEWVSHSGCHYSGHKHVIEVFGVKMTPDHKLLIGGEWVEAQHVRDRQNPPHTALFRIEMANSGDRKVPAMWSGCDLFAAERDQAQQTAKNALCGLCVGQASPHDRNTDLVDLARDASTVKRHARQELRWSWNRRMPRVARLFALLRRHVNRLLGRIDNRAHRRQQAVQQIELSMGVEHGAAGQQAQQPIRDLSWREDALGRVGETVGRQQDDVDDATQPRNDGRRSGDGCEDIALRQGTEGRETSDVYDLVDCGPRHRFVIRNAAGQALISHNSMGHGIDGLQKTGRTLVWFGLNWSLDLYDQFNARVRRQGQGAPVICHRIMCRDTLDQAQAIALNEKATTQNALRGAVKQYRQQKGV